MRVRTQKLEIYFVKTLNYKRFYLNHLQRNL